VPIEGARCTSTPWNVQTAGLPERAHRMVLYLAVTDVGGAVGAVTRAGAGIATPAAAHASAGVIVLYRCCPMPRWDGRWGYSGVASLCDLPSLDAAE
jgi:hypothetical protein